MRKLGFCLITFWLVPLVGMADAPTPPCNPCSFQIATTAPTKPVVLADPDGWVTAATVFWIAVHIAIR
jgi:hypothetical protein